MRHVFFGSLAIAVLFSGACSGTADTVPFDGSGGGTSSGQGGGNTTSSSGTNTGGSTGTSSTTCTGAEQKCEGAVHFVCDGGQWTQADCPAGQGCDATTGTCAACACSPANPPVCIDDATVQQCSPSCTELESTPCPGGTTCFMGACVNLVCIPGSTTCADTQSVQVCLPDGSGYEPAVACGQKEACVSGSGCQPLCDIALANPSSVGCSFFALNMDNFNEGNPDAVVIGNTSDTLTAVVNLYGSPGGVETLLQGNVQIPPLGLYTWMLPNGANDVIEAASGLRVGGAFRLQSDIPVIAYQHSPLQPQATNDASCLLPEGTLGTHYVVGSYLDALGSYPSYVNVVGTAQGTTVTVRPKTATVGGSGVPAISAGQTQTFTLNRYDTLQISAAGGSGNDITGMDVLATAPVAVFGAVECAQVPAGYTYCDHLEEQSLPEQAWGQIYVGAHAPKRGLSDRYYWRVIAYKDNTTIDTQPQQTGFPQTLNANQFYEFWTQESFIFTGNEAFAAIQYVTGQDAFGAGTGDPAMMTAVPVEQFLNRYVVLTPSGYSKDYLQVIRPAGGADVFIDGNAVPANEYYTVGQFQVADHLVGPGQHSLLSVDPFGIMGVGYTGVTSYAYPGGLALKILHQ